VYRLPVGTPQARGKALVNLLPLDEDEKITTLMPLPEDEKDWNDLDIMFATALGNVRRNKLSDFTNVMANGKIAMKLKDNDSLIGVLSCNENQDVLLATQNGRCIRFPVTAVRVFAGRSSSGVRGMRIQANDQVISLSILKHTEFSVEERNAYLRRMRAERLSSVDDENSSIEEDDTSNTEQVLSEERYSELAGNDELILTIAANGYGKRTSAYEYTIRNRGGQGITNIALDSGGRADNSVVASFPVINDEQLVIVSDQGQMIRTSVEDIRIAGRSTRGVIVFRVGDKEKVVSVSALSDNNEGDQEAETTEPQDQPESTSNE
ncbi:MAG: DNA gyrase C-terminal beta-propeller domain-containing protein, partial [Rhodospirillaceae bacterium]